VQVSNELAMAQIQQIQMLRQLVMAQTNAQNVVAGNAISTQQQQQMEAMGWVGAPASGMFGQALKDSGPPPPQ
jgi:hypothetical protein